jgi:replicative DNA helicase
MDLDKEFIHAVLTGGEENYRKAVERGIEAEVHLWGEGRIAWKYLVEHKREYGVLPSKELVCSKLAIDLSALGLDSFQSLLDEVFRRRLFQVVSDGAIGVQQRLQAKDPKSAAEAWDEIHRKIIGESLTVSKVESLLALGSEVLDQYERAKAGARGITTPWPTMTEQTTGWWPKDLALFVGRLGVGKTWVLVITTHTAWRDKRKCLFISTEMDKVRVAQRFFALHLKLPYESLRKGKLGEFVEAKMRTAILPMLGEHGINVVGGGFDYSIQNLELVVDENRPDFLAVDGPYLIKNQGRERHERVSNTFDDLKRIGMQYNCAVAANTQFNRSAKTGQAQTIDAANIGVTDVAGWNSDAIYGLWQTDEMRANSQMGWKGIKNREGRLGDFLSRWDLEKMDFSEIREGADSPPPFSDDAPAAPAASADDSDYDDVPF